MFYVMRPTWAHARAEVPEQLAGPVPVWTEPPHVSIRKYMLVVEAVKAGRHSVGWEGSVE